jgi:hypothetical protein
MVTDRDHFTGWEKALRSQFPTCHFEGENQAIRFPLKLFGSS